MFNFIIYNVKAWEETIAICNTHIAHYLRSKDNNIMKFVQLTEYNMRKVFPEKSYTKYDGESFPRPYS